MTREFSSGPRLVLGAAIVACVGLIGLLGAGTGDRHVERSSRAPDWRAPSQRSSVDLLRPAEVPPEPAEATVEELGAPPEDARATRTPGPEALRLRGDVFLRDGSPAANARILVGRHSERCNREGHFDFPLPSVPADADLLAFLPGHEPARITAYGARFAAGATEDHVRLVLGPPSLSIAGTVVDSAGRAHKNWIVELAGDDPLGVVIPREVVRTDAQGAFRVPDVPTGWFALRVRRSPHDEGFVTQEFEAGELAARVILED
jgi:hypothetical protein